MKVGKKSLLFGVHQFLWHPITVLAAWWHLYGRPSWKELICIIIHDWGYWFTPNMDGLEGEQHPLFAARLAGKWLGPEYSRLCLYHSRHYSRHVGVEPSKLCWADKLSIKYEPWWFYLPRAWASGELMEYRQVAATAGFISLSASNRVWYSWVQARLLKLGIEKNGDAVPYANPDRRKI